MSDSIFTAASADDFAAFAALIREYVAWSRTRYAADAWFVDAAFGHQALGDELMALATHYGAPNGRTLLAKRDGEILGGGAYRARGDGICEMKRLFVSDRFRGRGTGRRLCEALIASARDEEYRLMRLDTANLLTEAIAMYRSLGFRDCAPYNDYPEPLRPYIVFMELSLTPATPPR